MTTHFSTTRRIGSRSTSRIHITRRGLVIPAGALVGIALLLAGCGRDTANASGPTAASAPSAAMSDGFDHVGPAHGDEEGVAAVADRWDAAWNAGDGNAIGALFVPDADFVNGRSQVASGAAMIAANHVTNLAGVFKGSQTSSVVRRIDFLSGTTAVLDVVNTLTGFRALPPGVVATAPGKLITRHKRIVVKRDGTWLIESAQLTTIPPTAPAP